MDVVPHEAEVARVGRVADAVIRRVACPVGRRGVRIERRQRQAVVADLSEAGVDIGGAENMLVADLPASAGLGSVGGSPRARYLDGEMGVRLVDESPAELPEGVRQCGSKQQLTVAMHDETVEDEKDTVDP